MDTPALTAKAVFDRAHEITSEAERQTYLDQACAGVPELRRQVEALLRALAEAPESFLAKPACPLPATGSQQSGGYTSDYSPEAPSDTVDHLAPPDLPPPGEEPDTQIGPYRLVRKLGEGGMGAVYLAEQEQPIRRQVALKIIKPGMDSAQVVARFEAERQALTLMDHPSIARVYDAGTTDSGLPYFVMELVQGIPLTSFCNENTLTLRQRLLLFVTICQAVQHAHQKGILHRDLKPSNILVSLLDGQPVPKVIDFGLAKATEPSLTEQTQLTQVGAVVGTLEYMSPEQADFSSQKGVDTRTDVYSLGVMLYEQLTGTTPLDRSQRRSEGLIEVLGRIREEETPEPSVRVASLGERLAMVAAERRTEPARLVRLLRGELDWIALKALEKSRSRRYESASDLARDVQRYLNDEPVEACPPSVGYRLGKFVRKHRVLTGFVALLVVGVVGLIAGLIAVNNARQRAVTAEKRMRNALNMTFAGIRSQVRRRVKLGDEEKMILGNMLRGYRQLLAEVGSSREVLATAAEAEFRMANLSELVGRSEDAEAGYRRALQQYEQLVGEFPAEAEYRGELARLNFDLANLLKAQDRRREAEAGYRRAIEGYEKLAADFPNEAAYRGELAVACNNLGVLHREDQEFAAAAKAFHEAVSLGEKVVKEKPDIPQYRIDLAAAHHNLGNIVRDQGDAKAALSWYGKAIGLLTPLKPRPADATLFLRNAHWDRANALGQLGRHADASEDWQRALDLDEGPDGDHLRLFLAAAQMEVKLQAQSQPPGELLYEAATACAQATRSAKATDELGLQKRYGQRALELLAQARTAGWFHDPQRIKHLQETRDFDALPRPNFQAFLETLEAGKGTQKRSD
jgi:serine/threonine protein kinase/tetratricopeptide (TPR) repeat protein